MKRPSTFIQCLIPRLQDVIFSLVFYFVLLIGTGLLRDGDPGRHITIGKYIIQNRAILTHDIFSYTLFDQPFTPHEWLAQVTYGGAYLLFGLNGIVLLAALLIALTTTLIYREILHRDVSSLIAIGMALWAAVMTSIHWLARPHLFTFLYLALWTPRLLRLAKNEHVPLWQFPVIMLLWANTHGAFLAGFVVWGIILAGWLWDTWRNSEKPPRAILHRLLLAGGLSFLATFINPVGWQLWITSVGYVTNRYLVDLTSEYRSPDFHGFGIWILILFASGTLLILSRNRNKLLVSESLLLAFWVMLGLYSVRNLPLFAIVATPILATCLQSVISNLSISKLLAKLNDIEHQLHGALWSLVVMIVLSVTVVTGHYLDAKKEGYQFNEIEFPVKAVNWLESHPQEGRMFNFFAWGGYLIYRMWPEQLVFMDGQLDFYGETLTRQHQQILNADAGWEEVIQEYDIRWVLVPSDSPIATILRTDEEWRILFQDQTALIGRKY